MTGLDARLDFCGGAGIPVRGNFDARGSGSPVGLLESILEDRPQDCCSVTVLTRNLWLPVPFCGISSAPGMFNPCVPQRHRVLLHAPGFRRIGTSRIPQPWSQASQTFKVQGRPLPREPRYPADLVQPLPLHLCEPPTFLAVCACPHKPAIPIAATSKIAWLHMRNNKLLSQS